METESTCCKDCPKESCSDWENCLHEWEPTDNRGRAMECLKCGSFWSYYGQASGEFKLPGGDGRASD